MERFEECKEKAIKHMNLADHVLTMTYPLVQDPKLLKLVLKNIYLAMENTLAMLLNFERYYKRIPPFTENYDAMLHIAKPVFEKYKISTNYLSFLSEIKEILNKQKESDVEFVRKDKFVFADKDYDLNAVSLNEIKEHIAKAKLFMQQIINVVENERSN